MLKDLNYWNVELQEAYYSPVEANERFKNLNSNIYFHLSCVQIHSFGLLIIIVSRILFNLIVPLFTFKIRNIYFIIKFNLEIIFISLSIKTE